MQVAEMKRFPVKDGCTFRDNNVMQTSDRTETNSM